ncbi:uncharacterized protein LOC108922769 isoform X1 [Scleropages formosus]|uniref:uncharacterized protein LOC108922769 isoform X1 n=1 Tax=Scleropages formosus TaxID=113540 RepID=UPI0010FAA451|nr:uncharacterized protein LOC108922769 isoform X1 [Scleropages formosus]
MASKEITACSFITVSREITESLRRIIDKSTIKFVRGIKLDTKSGKSEDRILVLTTWRLYLLTAKVPTKVEVTFNFLEIRAMNSFPEHQVVIETDRSSYSLRLQTRDHHDHVVNYISFALSRIFNNSAFAPSFCRSEADPSDGSRKYSPSSETSVETQRACGGFSETYTALCDYNGISCKEEVQWDVDTIYHSQDNREFSLLDFSHLETRDLAVIVASMAYNTWFTKLYCKDMRIGSEVVEQILHTLSKSSSLEELTLENVGLKSDFPQKLSVALSENPASGIHSVNLAHNTLDNQGVSNLIQQVCRLSKGLRLLNLSKTSLSSKGVVSLSQALCSTDEYSNSLLHLDLSKNPGVLSGEDASNLYHFLSQPNCLVHLDLSATDCVVDSLFGPLLQGCCADLSYLNLSRNSFSHRKAKESLPLFRQFFSSAFSLTHVSLASMKLPPEALRALLLGLSSNPHINDLHLDISSCELRSPGAAVIQELFPRVSSIATLDVSDNGLDTDLLSIIPALSRHPSLKHLFLGKNFNIKSRVLDEVLQNLVQLIQEEECGLQSLSLADSRLRSRGTVLVNALGSNTCLRKVDLSGNSLEDLGAKMLGKALQINTTLRSVTWDRNNTTSTGFLDIARALDHNFTLQYMPLPLSDATQAYRNNPEKTEQALTKIQRALLRNNQTQRFSQRQALRLHQGLVTSTAEQVMERLCVRVQQQLSVLRGAGQGEELQAAKQVLKEARNSRALYPSLCELAHVLSVDGPVRQRLDSLAGELAKAADKELQVIVDSMVSLCRELCPLSSSTAERLTPPLSSVTERVSVPRCAIRSALMERAALDIHRAMEEVKLSVVSYLTNSIVDQILQELYSMHKSLTHQVAQVKHWEDDGDGGTGSGSHRHRDSLEMTDEELAASIDTLAIKKRSGRTRRIRPVSTRLSLCDDSSSSTPPSAPPLSSPLSRSASWECLSTLPTQGAPLHHVTRVRPRPPRRHRGGHASLYSHCTENGVVTPIDDGLPDFYTKRVLPDSQLSSLHKAQSLRRKKRRNMLAIFSFRRNRHSTLSNQGTETGGWGGACGDECRTVATAPTGTATENVYTLLQPPRIPGRADSPGEGAEKRVEKQRETEQVGQTEVQSPQDVRLGLEGKPSSLSSRQMSEAARETDRQTHRQTLVDPAADRDSETERQTHGQKVLELTIDSQARMERQTPTQTGTAPTMNRQPGTERWTPKQAAMDGERQGRGAADISADRKAVSERQTHRETGVTPTVDGQSESERLTHRPSEADSTLDRETGAMRQAHRLVDSDLMIDRQSGLERQTYRETGVTPTMDRPSVTERQTYRPIETQLTVDGETRTGRQAHRQVGTELTIDRHTGSERQKHREPEVTSTMDRPSVTERQTYRQTETQQAMDTEARAGRQSYMQVETELTIDRHSGLERQTYKETGVTPTMDRPTVTERQMYRQIEMQPTMDRERGTARQAYRQAGTEQTIDRQSSSERHMYRETGVTPTMDRPSATERQMYRQLEAQQTVDRETRAAKQAYRQVGTELTIDRQSGLQRQTYREPGVTPTMDRPLVTERQTYRQTETQLKMDREAGKGRQAYRHVGADPATDRQIGLERQIHREAVVSPTTDCQPEAVRQIYRPTETQQTVNYETGTGNQSCRHIMAELTIDRQSGLERQTHREVVLSPTMDRHLETERQMGAELAIDRQRGLERHMFREAGVSPTIAKHPGAEIQAHGQLVVEPTVDRETGSERQAYRQAVAQIAMDRQSGTERQLYKEAGNIPTMDRQTERQIYRQTEKDSAVDRQPAMETQTHRHAGMVRQMQRQAGREPALDRQTHSQSGGDPVDGQTHRLAGGNMSMDRQGHTQTGDQMDRQIHKESEGDQAMDRHTYKHAGGDPTIDTQTYRQIGTDSAVDKETFRQTGRDPTMDRQPYRKAAGDTTTDRLSYRQITGDPTMDRQKYRQVGGDPTTDRQVHRQARGDPTMDRQVHRQAGGDPVDRQTYRQTGGDTTMDRQVHRQAGGDPMMDRQVHRQAGGDPVDRQTYRQTGALLTFDRQIRSERQTQRQTVVNQAMDRQGGTDTQRDRRIGEFMPVDRQSSRVPQGLYCQVERHSVSSGLSDRQAGSSTLDRHSERRMVPVTQVDRQKDSVQTDGQPVWDAHAYRRTASENQGDRQTAPDTQTYRRAMSLRLREQQAASETVTVAFTQRGRQDDAPLLAERRRVGGDVDRLVHYGRKPDPPPQSSKPTLAKLRQRHLQETSGVEDVNANGDRDAQRKQTKERLEAAESGKETEVRPPPLPEKPVNVPAPEMSNEKRVPPPSGKTGLRSEVPVPQGEEAVRPPVPVKPQRSKKPLSSDKGLDRDTPGNTERPSNRKPPVKKPRLPQNRTKSQELLGIAHAPARACVCVCVCVCARVCACLCVCVCICVHAAAQPL